MLPVWNLLNVCLCKVLTYNDFNIMLELTANTISIHITEQFQTNSNQINVVNFDCKCLQARRNNVTSNNSLRFTASGDCKIVCVLINMPKVWKKLILHTYLLHSLKIYWALVLYTVFKSRFLCSSFNIERLKIHSCSWHTLCIIVDVPNKDHHCLILHKSVICTFANYCCWTITF